MARDHFRMGTCAMALLAMGFSARAADVPVTRDAVLWYNKPAGVKSGMNEALAVGNGRLGGFIYGAPAAERIVLNEDSLWSGGENPSGKYDKNTFGSYEMLGELLINLPGHETTTNYRRYLNLNDALAGVDYQVDGVTYHRTYFASRPDGVLVVRLTADQPGKLSGSLRLNDAHKSTTKASASGLVFSGALANGLKYTTQLAAVNDGGTVTAGADGQLQFSGCNSLRLILGAGTDYAMNSGAGFRGDPPEARVAGQVKAALGKSYDELRTEQVDDFHALFNRVTLDLGATPAERLALPTNERKAAASKGGDPELEALLFQYGRYLMISCSRPGGLPANLQGLWADSLSPPWFSDYHANINVQMNYWEAEPANLAECHEPLFDLIQSQLDPWRKATAAAPEYQLPDNRVVRGWAIRTSHNIYGGGGWNWDKTANAWYCLHLWEHYAFGGDKDFLRRTAYPIIKETCQFWEDHLKALPDGRLVVPDGWSPEHGPHEDGVTYNEEIVWDLFNNYVEASTALGVDADYRAKVAAMRDQLVGPRVGSWGQILEWMEEKHITTPAADRVLDTPEDHHRHTSHLFGVFPGRQISIVKTPELAAAAKVSLTARGDGGDAREWSFAWRTALWARLHDGDQAYSQVLQLLADRNSCPNLLGLHPPMQMDGNFGITAGMCEMLLQSHEGEINLLPALPAAWATGNVTGLRARGGFTVDLTWANGKLTGATVHSTAGGSAKVRYGAKTSTLTLAAGESKAVTFE